MTRLTPARLNALKHGVSSKLMPYESADDYAAHQAKWHCELQPRGEVLNDMCKSIADNRWLRERNSRSMAIFASCHPFGRAVKEVGEGDWVEAAQLVLSVLNEQQEKHAEFAEAMRKRVATLKNAADAKRLIEATEKCAEAMMRLAGRNDMAMQFFLGLGDESRKQTERDVELDAKFQKLLTSFFQTEQMLATREKLLPPTNRQPSAGALEIDERPEKSDPKAAPPIPKHKTGPNPNEGFEEEDELAADWGDGP